MNPKHYLSDIDSETQTATCGRCGPVRVVRKGSQGFRCSIGKRDSNRKYKKTVYRYSGGVATLSRPEREALKEGQVCALCASDKELYVDHCHESGRIRGVLCSHCNFMLGHAKDSIAILERAIEYLRA